MEMDVLENKLRSSVDSDKGESGKGNTSKEHTS